MSRVRASVAMAVYNGEKYLKDQIDSILQMLTDRDELVISYDESKDSTLEIVREYEKNHKNVHCFVNTGKSGVCANFTNAVRHCRGNYIFLSDQDDIWFGNKIEKMIETMEKENADMVVHDGFITDAYLNKEQKTMFDRSKAGIGPVKNFIKGRLWGCCMLFRRKTMKYLLPFPDVTYDFPHDIFATVMVGIKGKIVMIPECFIMHRVHGDNVTPKKRNPISMVIYNRIILFVQIMKRLYKCRFV